MNKTKGRMIKREISNSKGFASLSPKAAVLFCMIIPHLNSHGKLNGGSGFIKDEICPRIEYLMIKNIPKLLKEISNKTNVKWFESDGRQWLHSISFLSEHQELKPDRLGQDLLPSYSGVTRNLLRSYSETTLPEVEVEVEVEGPNFAETSDEFLLASYLRNKIFNHNPRQPVPADNPVKLEKWSLELNRMIRLDRVEADDIANMIDWIFDGSSDQSLFWRGNILSAHKLRLQYPKLFEQSGKLEKMKRRYRERTYA